MKMSFLALLALVSSNTFAVNFDCYEQGLKLVSEHLEYASTEAFLQDNGEIFFCKTKTSPHREIMQWGDGSALVGIEFESVNGKCIVTEQPYTGQDDGDLDVDWATENCQDWE